ncbi:hypothetical protein MHU86_19790 [Fragilaria crotonensis]|nr:hypothetical protein MHU86_19790 [Fragilaria crotonensis]
MVYVYKTPLPKAGRSVRSARKAEDLDAFDDNVDVCAPIGANPVPPDTPTYPGLYHGALAFGSPRGSKHRRVHRFPSPNTTPDDDQDQPTKKKRRTSIKKGPQAAYHATNSDDNFDQIIQEDCNLHLHERNNKIAAPFHQGTHISHRATTPTKMAAKMQATSQGGGFYMDSYIVHYFTNYVQTFYNLYLYVFYINMEFSTKTIQNKCTTYGTPILYFKHIHAYSEHLYV